MSDDATWPAVIDGELAADGRISISAQCEGLSNGDGLFETLPVLGARPRFLAAHLRRLQGSAQVLGLGPAPDAEATADIIRRLVDAAGHQDFTLRLVLFREGRRTRLLATASPLPVDVSRPVRLGIAADWLNGPRPMAAHKTLNYLASRLAHQDGVRRGFDEVLFTMPDGTVLEGTRSSIFILEGESLVTPPLTAPILPGVTREVILDEARRGGIPVREECFGLDRLRRAGEAFISASVRGLRPVLAVGDGTLAAVNGPVTNRLAIAYARRLAEG